MKWNELDLNKKNYLHGIGDKRSKLKLSKSKNGIHCEIVSKTNSVDWF